MELAEKDWLVALHHVHGVGAKTILRCKKNWPTVSSLAVRSPEEISDMAGVSQKKATLIRQQMTTENVLMVKRQLQKSGIHVWTLWDEDYPEMLKQIHDPPPILYGYGERTDVFRYPMFSIVGARQATPYGTNAAFDYAFKLSRRGWVIVSGLARGIDAAAHRGALEAGGLTVAVMGCGLEVVYPREHVKLFQDIAKKGLVLSECTPNTSPSKGLFPKRNRLISGLSLGTMVVEAAEKSGSLITADQALEQGKEVFAVPGSVYSPKSVGPNRLIKQGAKLAANVADIMDEFPYLNPLP